MYEVVFSRRDFTDPMLSKSFDLKIMPFIDIKINLRI